MPLTTGTRIGVYEIVSKLGEGGMGEVYRAYDTGLKRDVALKVLPATFTQDRDRLTRFRREAELLASLNHPHIASIYGLVESDGVHAIAMELVDGGTLADRLGTDGALALSDALAIARQIAEALEAAHDRGVIHRDLKPANVALTADGQVKVLDFGLAKALVPDAHPVSNVGDSPTLTSPAMTQLGLILGTAAYMSPEQAKGRPVDKRSDIWAFGCVLYEMLTGRRPFDGEDVSDTLAAVLRGDPDWTALPKDLPPPIRTLLRRCLERDRRRRVGDIAAALFVFDEPLIAPAQPLPVTTGPLSRPRERLLWLAATIGLAAVTGALVLYWVRPDIPVRAAVRFEVVAPPGTNLTTLGTLALSPDGRYAVFPVTRVVGQEAVLAIRSLDTLESRILDHSEGAGIPFWSPDSRFVAFAAGGKLKKIDTTGGPPQVLCDAPALSGGTWNADGTIVFAPSATGGLMRVSQAGGTPTVVTELDAAKQERSHRWPWFLPDGRRFLFVTQAPTKIFLGSIDSRERTELLAADSKAVYADGHLLFVRGGSLLAQPFDPDATTLTGEAFPVVDNVLQSVTLADAAFSASSTGSIAYRTQRGREVSRLVWFDRTGRRIGVVGEEADQMSVALSDDNDKVAVSLLDPARNTRDIAIYDLARGGLRSRFTFDPADEWSLVWSPDGASIAFSSNRKDGQLDVYTKATNGAGAEALLLDDPGNNVYPADWSPDGRFFLYTTGTANSATGNDLFVLPMTGARRTAIPFMQSAFNEHVGRFSPDGRSMAFQSNETGRTEVVVAPFTGTEWPTAGAAGSATSAGKWQVSVAGGVSPHWRRDGKELFYLSPDGKVMAAEVRTDGLAFQVGDVRPLFDVRVRTTPWLGYGAGANLAVSADGQRFLVNTVAGDTALLPAVVVLNWTAGLKR